MIGGLSYYQFNCFNYLQRLADSIIQIGLEISCFVLPDPGISPDQGPIGPHGLIRSSGYSLYKGFVCSMGSLQFPLNDLIASIRKCVSVCSRDRLRLHAALTTIKRLMNRKLRQMIEWLVKRSTVF